MVESADRNALEALSVTLAQYWVIPDDVAVAFVAPAHFLGLHQRSRRFPMILVGSFPPLSTGADDSAADESHLP